MLYGDCRRNSEFPVTGIPDCHRNSLFVLGFAPLAVMAFWLVRLRFAKALCKLTQRLPVVAAGTPLKLEV